MLVLGSQLDVFLDKNTNNIEILGAHFKADWSKMIFLYYDGKACPQILNPEFQNEIPEVDSRTESWIGMARLDPILPTRSTAPVDPESINLGSEPEKNWCYYFEKADLARQTKDWGSIRSLGDEAIYNRKLKFLTDTELFPFIQAYGLGGEWQKSLELLKQAVEYQVNRDGKPNLELIQSTWSFIDQNTFEVDEKSIFGEYIRQLVKDQ